MITTVILISFAIVFFFISIPSTVEIFKVGVKSYFKKWHLIFKIRVKECIVLETNQQYVYKYPDGSTHRHNHLTQYYYYPIYKKNGDIYIIRSIDYLSINSLISLDINLKNESGWQHSTIELKPSICLYQSFFEINIKRQMVRLKNVAKRCESHDELEKLVNSNSIEMQRESKLEKILK